MASLSKVYSCDKDGVCMVCKQNPSSNDVISCNSCASLCHISCLPVDFYAPPEMTMSYTSISWLCPDCSPVHHPVVRMVQDSDKCLICFFCLRLPERPITAPCGHNFCLVCFKKWIKSGKQNCGNCGSKIPTEMARQPRINTELASAIRMWKASEFGDSTIYDHYINQQEVAKKRIETTCSGRICVRVSEDHFGPILPENDLVRNEGVAVGEAWKNRIGCRQWGIHIPIVAGVAGKSTCGAQSVVLCGGSQDVEDHGQWFLYTGCDRTDHLGGDNIGTSNDNDTSLDKKLLKSNEALRMSCLEGYPVRIVRTHKEKQSSYAPETGTRYDGIYRIEKCWRKYGIQGQKVCRFLFVRCDNEPAPWTSDEHGDRPRPLPEIEELKNAMDLSERQEGAASWDFDESEECWLWKKPPPHKDINDINDKDVSQLAEFTRRLKATFIIERLLREYRCNLCMKMLSGHVTTPCAHSFCLGCLYVFVAESHVRRCPSCADDISHFLDNDNKVNEELMNKITSLQRELVELEDSSSSDDESFQIHLDVDASESNEDQSNKHRRTNETAICLMNRQQTIDEFLEEEEEEEDNDDDDEE